MNNIKLILSDQAGHVADEVLNQAIKTYQTDEPVFLIVPNHLKFTTEVKALNTLAKAQGKETTSVNNLHVLSFSRLAWYFLNQTGAKILQSLDDSAISMLLAKIITEKKSQLTLLKSQTITPGLIKQLYQTINQLKENQVDLSDIEALEIDEETKLKLQDLAIINLELLKRINDKFSTKSDLVMQFNKLIPELDQLANSHFFFAHFSYFTKTELTTIFALIKKAKTVCLGFQTKDGSHYFAQKEDYDYVCQKTIYRITDFCKKRSIKVNYQSLPTSQNSLLRLWSGQISELTDMTNPQLVIADSRYSEVYYAARTIYQKVSLGQARFKDFLVLAPDLRKYESYLDPVLRQMGIPYFNDLEKEMKYHPLVIFLENLAEFIEHPYQSSNIFAMLKTALWRPAFYQNNEQLLLDLDQLENLALAGGINGQLWHVNCDEWADLTISDGVEKLRQEIVNQLEDLLAKLKTTDPQKGVSAFFNWIKQIGLPDRLDEIRNESTELQVQAQPKQLWDLLLNLLHDYLLIEEQKFDVKDFFNLLVSGFSEAQFSQIPATLDAVTFSEFGISQAGEYQEVFIIGATGQDLPKNSQNPGYLTPENVAQFEIDDQRELNTLDQAYQFGNIMAISQKLHLTYPFFNSQNEAIEPSFYWLKFKNWQAPVTTQHDLPNDETELAKYLTNPNASLGFLAYLNSVNATSLTHQLLETIKQYIATKVTNIQKALRYDNNPEDLSPELAQRLYGNSLSASVSQLESYYQNSFEYFLKYGLKLHPRNKNEFDSIQAGNYLHATMDLLVKTVQKAKLNFADLSADKLAVILAQVQDKLKEQAEYRYLKRDKFNQYLFRCLDKTSSVVAQNLLEKIQNDDQALLPVSSELTFGLGEKMPGLKYDLGQLGEINIRGKIDRLDRNAHDFQVIDYKSSHHEFDLKEFYYGLSLQMMTYLAVINNRLQADEQLIGGLYQHFTRSLPLINRADNFNKDLVLKPNDHKNLKYFGIYIDHRANNDNYAKLRSKTANFTQAEFELLLKQNEKLIKEAGQDILSGKLALNPYRIDQRRNGLTYSDYKDIFFFDHMFANNQYREITPQSRDELLTEMKGDAD
ncbi:MAG: PD-(D/E)XK nuclease family protein [Lactobacillus sp.]|nr:PD-(D/E)XK nuclease family protein [Lactobacillus sp.]